MPFFSPQQFSSSKRRPLRSAEITTPHRSTPILLPIPDSEGNVNVLEEGVLNSKERRTSRQRPPRATERANGTPAVAEHTPNGYDPVGHTSVENANGSHVAGVAATPAATRNTETANGQVRQGSKNHTTGASFMWSSPRPSAWSLKTPVDSVDQYDPEKYLPYQTKEGFYTVPTMAELASRTMKELQSVEGFTVGREGFGEIRWVEPVDVRGLDLDSVVDIQRGEVAVFPDQDASQLDTAAVITLERMYKKDKRTGTPTTDKNLSAKYTKKLQAFCEKNRLRFVSYSPEDGRWQFEAPGFSEE